MTSPCSFLQLMSHTYGIVPYYLEPGEAFPLPTMTAHLSPGSIPLQGISMRILDLDRYNALIRQATHVDDQGIRYKYHNGKLWVFKCVPLYKDTVYPCWVLANATPELHLLYYPI